MYFQELIAAGEWKGQEQDEHINILEVRAVLNTVMMFQDRMMGQDSLISNTCSVVVYMSKGGRGPCPDLCQLTRDIPVYRMASPSKVCKVYRRFMVDLFHPAGAKSFPSKLGKRMHSSIHGTT